MASTNFEKSIKKPVFKTGSESQGMGSPYLSSTITIFPSWVTRLV